MNYLIVFLTVSVVFLFIFIIIPAFITMMSMGSFRKYFKIISSFFLIIKKADVIYKTNKTINYILNNKVRYVSNDTYLYLPVFSKSKVLLLNFEKGKFNNKNLLSIYRLKNNNTFDIENINIEKGNSDTLISSLLLLINKKIKKLNLIEVEYINEIMNSEYKIRRREEILKDIIHETN